MTFAVTPLVLTPFVPFRNICHERRLRRSSKADLRQTPSPPVPGLKRTAVAIRPTNVLYTVHRLPVMPVKIRKSSSIVYTPSLPPSKRRLKLFWKACGLSTFKIAQHGAMRCLHIHNVYVSPLRRSFANQHSEKWEVLLGIRLIGTTCWCGLSNHQAATAPMGT